MMPIIASDIAPSATSRFPGFGPVGSVYQPTAYFPTDQNTNVIARGGVPPSSRYGAVRFPVDIWNKNYNPGNPLAVFSQGSR